MITRSYLIRERAHREAGGVTFTLLWREGTRDLWVAVLDDVESNVPQLMRVPADKALDAFYHPYAYGCPLPLAAESPV